MDEHVLDKIGAYLAGDMSPEEQAGFESEMAADEALALTVRMYRAIETEMRNQPKDVASEASLRQTLEEASLRYFTEEATDTSMASPDPIAMMKTPNRTQGKRITTVLYRTFLTAAASILVIFGLSVVIYFSSKGNRPRLAAKITEKHLDTLSLAYDADTIKKPDYNLSIRKSAADSVIAAYLTSAGELSGTEQKKMYAVYFQADKAPDDKCDLEEELELYEKRNYKEAIVALNDARIATRGERECDHKLVEFYNSYYLAISYMAIGRVKQAIPELQSALRRGPDGLSKSKVQWYLALAWLDMGDQGQSERLLKKLANDKQAGVYKGRALKILNNLAIYK